MAHVTVGDIEGLGFFPQMYEQSAVDFEKFLIDLINEQAGILNGRVGSAYTTTENPIAVYLKRAEKALVAGELCDIRINLFMGNVVHNEDSIDTKSIEKQRDKYLAEANKYITKIVAGIERDSNDFSCSVVITSHED